MEFAVVRYRSGEERPNDFKDLLSTPESIRFPTAKNSIIDQRQSYKGHAPDQVVFWYSATGYQSQDAFFIHGGFFSPAVLSVRLQPNIGTSALAALSTDGITWVTYANLYQDGPTTVTSIDPNTVGPLPPGYTAYNNVAYNLITEAVVSGPHLIEFQMPSVSDPTAFNNLRVFHWEPDPFNPARMKWIDRTILPPDPLAPDFTAKTINARVMNIGKFVVATLTSPQPPNTAMAELAITGSGSPNPVTAGNNLTYTLTVTNNGPQAATEATLINGLDAGADFVSATSAQGNCVEEDGTVICELGTLAAGASATVTIVVKPAEGSRGLPPEGATITNTAFVTANEGDTSLADNEITTSTTALPDPNAAPTVNIMSPANGALFTGPANITITATASDSDGSISKVDFFNNGDLIGTGTPTGANQYSFTWNNVAVGNHTVVAIATDNAGKHGISSVVTLIVNPPFMVSITRPAWETIFTAPANVPIVSKASDLNGTISRVDYYANGTLIGSGAPSGVDEYTLMWSNAPAGNYTLTAVATNNLGATTTSSPVDITVNTLPTVSITSPTAGALFTAPASVIIAASAGDGDGYVGRVDFYANGSFIGSGTLVGAGTVTGPNQYSFTWNHAAAGNYALQAVARDSLGAARTSSAINITVNAPPVVSIASPSGGAVFATPANINIIANASDSGGSISRVDFYADGSLLGAGASIGGNQYSFTWNTVPGGSHSLTAVAIDNHGATTTSSSVNITVTAPPAVSITSPTAGALYTAPASIPITADTSDADGSISRVDFYANGVLIGVGTPADASQYSFTWSNVSVGVYSLTAIATDNVGASTTSTAISVTVSAPALLVTSSTTLNASDDAVKMRLQALGYAVTVKDAGSSTSADATGKTVVVISATVSPTALGTKFRSVAVPVVIWGPDSFSDMGMVGSGNSSGATSGQTQVSLTNPSHPMAGGLSGIVTVITASSAFGWGKPNGNAVSIATLVSDATRQVIFGYDKGAAMPGLTAPARRVGLFMSDDTAANFNDNGWALFDAAIRWAISNASLSGNVAVLSAGSMVDLTAEGAIDWAHWGLNSVNSFDHKAGASQPISNYSPVGTQLAQRLTDSPAAFSWTDGTPTLSIAGTTTGISVSSTNNGFQISVPADTNLKTLRLYVGVGFARGRLEATLSDNSAPAYLDASLVNSTGVTNGVYTISFKAGSSGQMLTVKYTVSFDYSVPNGNVSLASATLFSGYPPIVSITSPVNGAIFTAPASITVNATASDADGSISRVDFYAGSTLIGTDSSSPFSITWSNVAAGNYMLTARATDNSDIVTVSNPVSITVNPPPPVPNAPSNLTATAVSKSQINLAWADNATTETGFKIERSTDNINFTQIATVGANVTSYQNTGLSRSTTYYYRVRTYNGGGDSAYSNTASATTPAR
ncbi:MAG TPA: Ig-like domain-containing protein [Blastocatellia bacterium]|nr:Ig-like domain-containing protein [Blastocatellia bacterium]